MTPIEAKQLKLWLTEKNAVMFAYVENGAFVVRIQSAGWGGTTGIGISPDDFEGAIRAAQHFYDLGLMQMARITVGPVGIA